MANLDTPSKRISSVGLLVASTLALPLPDGTLSAGDRQHQAHSYSGILASAVVAPTYPLILGDFTTLLSRHFDVLYAANPDDLNTLLSAEIPTVRADVDSGQKDLDTDYTKYLG